ncbi:MAG: Lrp/AsnC ligand binding domain-containing protein [Acidimicrobiales bacterium]|nr:Lrp/AsnC ligand binding domain-containing protein [Acidimicrobiales bacterium]
MSVNAYILIQADVGTAADVARQVGALDSVLTAEVAMGPYDVIARAEAASMDELGQVVVHAVQAIAGVERTLLCPIVHI